MLPELWFQQGKEITHFEVEDQADGGFRGSQITIEEEVIEGGDDQ